jgi:hypothetical protein
MADGDKLTGTFVGTFTGTFTPTASPAPSPAPSPTPTPPPPASQAESPNGTTLPPAPAIFDSQGVRWSVANDKIRRDGVDTVSSNVALLLYHGGVVYQKNNAGGWWKWQNNTWADSFDPRVSTSAPPSSPAPSPAPGPTPAPSADIPLVQSHNNMLQMGKDVTYWLEDNMWGTAGMTRGTYTGVTGNKFESAFGRSTTVGPNGEVAWRVSWKVPKGSSEVKGYHAVLFGAKPGYQSDWNNPSGFAITLPDGSVSTKAPSGATPGSFLPIPANGRLPPIYCSFDYRYPTGRPQGLGQLTFDIWLQDSPQQIHGFKCPPISHEIMIILDNWGGYGAYPTGRNPGWYSHDVTLDGHLWHVFFVRPFAGGWAFICFVPSTKIDPGTLNLATILNHLTTRTAKDGKPFATGNEHLVDIECGVESVEGTGDVQVSNYRIWK